MRTSAIATSGLVLAALLVAGCGGDERPPAKVGTSPPSPSAPATGMVQGRLVTVGGPAPGNPKPVPGAVTFSNPDGSTATTHVDGTGTFAIGLSPGTYEIRGTSPNVRGVACSTEKPTTTLTAGKTVTVDVICPIR